MAMTFAYVEPAGCFAARRASSPHLPDLALIGRASPVVQFHLYAALAAVGLGAVMMTSRKGARFHRVAGWIWVGLILLVAGSSLFITGLNGDKWSLIHLLAGWTLITAPLALLAARRHKVAQHRKAMMGIFYGGVLVAGALAFIPGRLLWNVFSEARRRACCVAAVVLHCGGAISGAVLSLSLPRGPMNIHEHQAKAVLKEFGVPVPRGFPAFSVEEAVQAAKKLGGPVWVVKAQIHAGGRGKGRFEGLGPTPRAASGSSSPSRRSAPNAQRDARP